MGKYDFVESFKTRFIEAMDLRGLNAADISKHSGLSEALISGYKNGRQEPKRENIAILAKTLLVSPVWLMGFDVPMKEEPSGMLFSDLPEDEKELILAYREQQPAIKNAARRVLGLKESGSAGSEESGIA